MTRKQLTAYIKPALKAGLDAAAMAEWLIEQGRARESVHVELPSRYTFDGVPRPIKLEASMIRD